MMGVPAVPEQWRKLQAQMSQVFAKRATTTRDNMLSATAKHLEEIKDQTVIYLDNMNKNSNGMYERMRAMDERDKLRPGEARQQEHEFYEDIY